MVITGHFNIIRSVDFEAFICVTFFCKGVCYNSHESVYDDRLQVRATTLMNSELSILMNHDMLILIETFSSR